MVDKELPEDSIASETHKGSASPKEADPTVEPQSEQLEDGFYSYENNLLDYDYEEIISSQQEPAVPASKTAPQPFVQTIQEEVYEEGDDEDLFVGNQPQIPSLVDTIPTSWEVNTASAQAALLFDNDKGTLATVPLTPELLEELVPLLNEFYIVPEDAPVSWIIRIPETLEAIPVLSMIKGGKVIGSVQLDQSALKQMMPTLQRYYREPNKSKIPLWRRATKWWMKHKIWGSLVIIILLPFVTATLWGVWLQLSASLF